MSERIAEIRARCEAATPGEWYADGDLILTTDSTHLVMKPYCDCDKCCSSSPTICLMPHDKDFIIHSHKDLPWALARIEELEAQLADALEEAKEIHIKYAKWMNLGLSLKQQCGALMTELVAVRAKNEQLEAELAASERREQAAVEDMCAIGYRHHHMPCVACKHEKRPVLIGGEIDTASPCFRCRETNNNFDWRGPQEAGKGVDHV